MACEFNTLLEVDTVNRTDHHLLVAQVQLLIDILRTLNPMLAVDFNSILTRANSNGFANRTDHKLLTAMVQLLCDLSGVFSGGSGVGVISGGNGDPNGVQTGSPPDIYVQYDAGGSIWKKTSGVGTKTGWE